MLKHQWKFFDINDWKKEQDYLEDMHQKGCKLKSTNGFKYTFESCEPEEVVYQLDYRDTNSKKTQEDQEDYIQMFEDCGWEYIQDLNGFSYFRKAKQAMNGKKEEIFCDEQSKQDMIKRVYQGRIIPLIIVFIGFLFIIHSSLDRPVAWILLVVVSVIYIYIIFKFIVYYRKVLFAKREY